MVSDEARTHLDGMFLELDRERLKLMGAVNFRDLAERFALTPTRPLSR
jgi:hypothetical protein